MTRRLRFSSSAADIAALVHPGKVICAATDFSPAASAATRRAAQLAKAVGARLSILHVMHPAYEVLGPVVKSLGRAGDGVGDALHRLEKTAGRLAANFDVWVDTRLAAGSVPETVAEMAEAASAELIVVANPRHGFLRELLLPSTAQRLNRRPSAPILAVTRPPASPYKRITLATDLSASAGHAGRMARRLLPEASVRLLHVCQLSFGSLRSGSMTDEAWEHYRNRAAAEALDRLRGHAEHESLGEAASFDVLVGHPVTAIRRRALETASDLLVLAPGSRTLDRCAGRVTKEILADPPCDVLLVDFVQKVKAPHNPKTRAG
jgi:nucleotide-binding universal stress UspA family protein